MSYLSVLFAALLLTISLCRGENCYGDHCASCTERGDCVKCEEGYYKSDGECYPNIPNCVVHSYFGQGCLHCKNGYVVSEDGMSCDFFISIPNCDSLQAWSRECEECCCGLVTSSDALSCVNRTTVEHCVRYQSNSVRCEECSDGLTISEDGLHCHNCSTVELCQYCDASDRCTECGWHLHTIGGISYFEKYSLGTDTDGSQVCVKKVENCKTYAHNGTCAECWEDHLLQGNTCTFVYYPTCISRDLYGRCEACKGGLEVSTSGYSCVTCNVKDCLSCYRNDMCGQYVWSDDRFLCDDGHCVERVKLQQNFPLTLAVIVVVVALLVVSQCVRCCVCLARRRRGEETQALLV
ncbi:CXXC-rich protein [Angomonas deanei]|uniref:Uncharacterized protein n=1 Tax=Angomonas deanei TaxID=59799 RepID=A0A7G2C3N8_9TRYP|nr:CXXC-rich protein [Angomonas deanei]CAD2214408.1 hypothetical protein, conserved [Angomonas deanei]|eukprot:EPY18982.1 CXXC-rich protein [Angomonas deanei]